MGRLYDWVLALWSGTQRTGRAQARRFERCFVCGRLPAPGEEGFTIYGQPICDDCFWENDVAYSPTLPDD